MPHTPRIPPRRVRHPQGGPASGHRCDPAAVRRQGHEFHARRRRRPHADPVGPRALAPEWTRRHLLGRPQPREALRALVRSEHHGHRSVQTMQLGEPRRMTRSPQVHRRPTALRRHPTMQRRQRTSSPRARRAVRRSHAPLPALARLASPSSHPAPPGRRRSPADRPHEHREQRLRVQLRRSLRNWMS